MTITASFNFSYQEWSAGTRFNQGGSHQNMGATYYIRDDPGQQEVLLVLMRALLITHQWLFLRFFINADVPCRRSGGEGIDAVNIDFPKRVVQGWARLQPRWEKLGSLERQCSSPVGMVLCFLGRPSL